MKKTLFSLLIIVFVALTALAVGLTYTLQEDSCKKCKISSDGYRCGLCNGTMTSKYIKTEGTSLLYKYQCDSCPHSCTYWVKQ